MSFPRKIHLPDRPRLRDFRIGARLRVAFSVVVLLIVLGGAVRMWHFREIRRRIENVSLVEQRMAAILRFDNSVLKLMSQLHRAAQPRSGSYFEKEARRLLAAFQAETTQATEALQWKSSDTARQAVILGSLSRMMDVLPARVDSLIDMARNGDWVALNARLLNQVDRTDDVIAAMAEEMDKDLLSAHKLLRQDVERAQSRAAQTLAAVGVLSLFSAVLLAVAVIRSITEPLASLAAGARGVASLDLVGHGTKSGRDELALLALQQFYTRSLIESRIDALMTTDPAGIISDINYQMEALTGRSRAELIGTPFKDHFTDPARAEEGVKLVLREGEVTDYELTALHKDGSLTVVSYNAAAFHNQQGEIQGVFAAARDVTERKRFEEALRQKNVELEQANLAKDRFLASMSHELRTPLNSVIGFTGTLLMKLAGPLVPEQERQLKTIQASARHLLSLINDLLDLAMIQSGNIRIHTEPIECGGLVKEVADSLGPLAADKNLTFDFLAPEKEVIARTDRRALRQILINLTYNAIKFTQKGSVRLQLGQEQVNGTITTSFVIADTGPGIKEQDQDKLFQPFTRLHPEVRDGTGLGLHVSQQLARVLGGRILLESEYGKGSTFTLLLDGDRPPA